jgi:hypothetical protein
VTALLRLRPMPLRSDHAVALRFARDALVVGAGSLVLGGLTSFGQTVLPDPLRPFANSASGWTLLTALLVWLCRTGPGRSAVLGAEGFVLLVLGYQVVSGLRGFVTSEELFLVLGVLAGPVVGAASSWLRRTDLHGAIGAAVLAGIGVGEGTYGLAVLIASTGWLYWTLIGIAGVALLVLVARRLDRPRDRWIAGGATAAIAAAFVLAYGAVGGI